MSSDSESSQNIQENSKKDEQTIIKVELTKNLINLIKNKIKKNDSEGFIEMTYIMQDIMHKHFGGKEFEKSENFSKKMSKTREGFKTKKGVKKETKCIRTTKYTTKNIKLIRLVILTSLRYIPKFLTKIFNNKKHPHLENNWKTMKEHVHRYISSLTIAISHVKNEDMCIFLKRIKSSFIYMQTFCDLSKILLKSLINCLINENSDIRKNGFSCTLEFIQTHKRYHRIAFKVNNIKFEKIYERYIKHYKPSIHGDTNIMESLLTNFIHLVRIYPDYAYQFIYEDLRNISQNLRTVISVDPKKKYQEIYNWRTISIYYLYSHVISLTEIENIKSLTNSLIELFFAILQISENPVYFPTQLHLIRIILILYSSKCYIPLLPNILKILLSKELTQSGVKSNEKSPLIKYMCHIPANLNHTQISKDALFDECFDILLEYLSISSTFVTFPEIIIIPLNCIKNALKTIKVSSISSQLKIVAKKCDETSKNILQERDKVDFSPLDNTKIFDWENAKLVPLKSNPKYFLNNSRFNTLVDYFNKWRANRTQIIQQLVDAHKNDDMSDDT